MSSDFEKPYNWYNLEPDYRKYLSAVKKIQPVSIKNYLSDLRYFFGWSHSLEYQSLQPETLMTADNLELYRVFLVEGNLPKRTINRRLSSLRSFCEFLITQNIISSDPSKKLRNHSLHEEETPKSSIFAEFISEMTDKDKAHTNSSTLNDDVKEFLALTGLKLQ